MKPIIPGTGLDYLSPDLRDAPEPVFAPQLDYRGTLVSSITSINIQTGAYLTVPAGNMQRKLWANILIMCANCPTGQVLADMVFYSNNIEVGRLPFGLTTGNGDGNFHNKLSATRPVFGLVVSQDWDYGGINHVLTAGGFGPDFMMGITGQRAILIPSLAENLTLTESRCVYPPIEMSGDFDTISLIFTAIGNPVQVYGYVDLACLSTPFEPNEWN